jgi:hypothetical protein
METYKLFHKAVGEPEQQIKPPDAFFKTQTAKIDEDLMLLWQEDGWARYGGGLFWTVDPGDFEDLHEDWSGVPKKAVVFGRNAFGDLFLFNEGEVFLLSTQINQLMSLGPKAHIFLNSTLVEADMRETFLYSKLFKAVRKRLGDLEADECYGLFPAMPAGGNEEDAKSYKRVKMREYLATVAQLHS